MKMKIEGEKAKIYVIQKTNDAVLTHLFKAQGCRVIFLASGAIQAQFKDKEKTEFLIVKPDILYFQSGDLLKRTIMSSEFKLPCTKMNKQLKEFFEAKLDYLKKVLMATQIGRQTVQSMFPAPKVPKLELRRLRASNIFGSLNSAPTNREIVSSTSEIRMFDEPSLKVKKVMKKKVKRKLLFVTPTPKQFRKIDTVSPVYGYEDRQTYTALNRKKSLDSTLHFHRL